MQNYRMLLKTTTSSTIPRQCMAGAKMLDKYLGKGQGSSVPSPAKESSSFRGNVAADVRDITDAGVGGE